MKRLREELGAVRSCALMMANSHSADTRSRYLRTLNDKLGSIQKLAEGLAGISVPAP